MRPPFPTCHGYPPIMSLFAWFSPQDMLIIGVIALLLFGNRLAERDAVARTRRNGIQEGPGRRTLKTMPRRRSRRRTRSSTTSP